MEIRFLDTQTLEFCPYTLALDVLLAGTTNTLIMHEQHGFDDSLSTI